MTAVNLWAGYAFLCLLPLALRYRKDKREFWVRYTIVAALPGIGWLLPLFWPASWRRKGTFTDLADQLGQYPQIGEPQAVFGVYDLPEAEKETNIVPLEEALVVNDHTTRRKMMIDLLKEDSLEYIEALQQAVSNEDTETSHYAVSAIVEAKRKLTIALQELSVKYEENKSDSHILRAYADVLHGYLRSGFLDPRTLYKYRVTYSNVLGRLIEASPEDENAYESKVETDIELNDFHSAEACAKKYMSAFPRSENAFLLLAKVYFEQRSFEKLGEALASLKHSQVRLSNKGLAIVRYWSKGEKR